MLLFRRVLAHLVRPPFAGRGLATAKGGKPFDKILIANRGEIACRVIRTAKRLGVKTVAVYSEADAAGMHVRLADEAYCIGPAASSESYLKMDRILAVCKKSGAQAIHPGYGFLSENAKFVDMVEAAGIVFIGPSSKPMNLMGDKINSKKIAKAANCFIIPGFEGEVEDEAHCIKLANDVGYPVMIKASAGGGGKGMRVAYNDAEVREGFRMSKAEARSSFGDDRMLIERFIEDPHHIEIQVIADSFGNVAAFPERECSVQRRNQKVVEESPSCLLTPATRKAMQDQAIALCKATGYRSAGTVEMLADSKQNFYFLEMNTRLQVEHPITELVSGEDLVEHMLWVAAGKPLPERMITQPHLPFSGWAIESRVYAEDPLRKFLPSIGPLVTYKEPDTFASPAGTVRIDTVVFDGGVISMYYDPMIAKLCTHSPTRAGAIETMEKALDQYVVRGLGNNLCFLRSVMRNERFRQGNYSTKFIPTEYPDGFKGVELTRRETHELVATAVALHHARLDVAASGTDEGAGEDVDGHNPNTLVSGDELVALLPSGEAFHVTVSIEDSLVVDLVPLDPAHPSLIPRSRRAAERVEVSQLDWVCETPLATLTFVAEVKADVGAKRASKKKKGAGTEAEAGPLQEERIVQYEGRVPQGYKLRFNGSQQTVLLRSLRQHALSVHMLPPENVDVTRFLLCPMPGTLVSCAVKEGQEVESGQELAVVEAMKMQNVLRAEKRGVVKAVKCAVGAHLKVDQVILEFESATEAVQAKA